MRDMAELSHVQINPQAECPLASRVVNNTECTVHMPTLSNKMDLSEVCGLRLVLPFSGSRQRTQ